MKPVPLIPTSLDAVGLYHNDVPAAPAVNAVDGTVNAVEAIEKTRPHILSKRYARWARRSAH